MSLQERTADTMAHILTVISEKLIAEGVKEDEAEAIAYQTCDEIRKNFGGSYIYLQKGREVATQLKHCKIYSEFRGNNQQELADKFDMSLQAVYRVLKAAQQKEFDEKQPKLF